MTQAFRVLEFLVARSPQGVAEIAEALELDESSVCRLLESLGDLGYVDSHQGRYRMSARILKLAPGIP